MFAFYVLPVWANAAEPLPQAPKVKTAEIGDGSKWWHVKAGTVTMSGTIWSVPQNEPLKRFEAWGFPN